MFSRIEKYLRKRANEIVFIELKEDKYFKAKNLKLSKDISLPIALQKVISKVNGKEENDKFSLFDIIQGMIFMLGIDKDFKYNKDYKEFLLNFDENIKFKILEQGFKYAQNDKKLDALICFKASLYIDKEDINALYNYARVCEELAFDTEDNNDLNYDFYDEALEVFEVIIEKYPDFSLAYYHLGFHYMNRKQYKKAELIWKTCIEKGIDEEKEMEILNKLSENNYKIQYEEGYSLVLNGRPLEALDKLLPLAEKYPEWWNLLFFVGLAYRHLKEYEKALSYFKRAHNLKPSQVDILNEMGLCYMSLGKIDDSIRYFKRAVNLKNDLPDILCNLGSAYIEKGDYEKAREYIMKSYKINPQDEITIAWMKELEKITK
ncbi:Tetratricopeptide repeat-containing protein [Caminicella sporogenes DSM 14501]|uniref:Tetratricopeptide repeat-containing protein n=1 Tax=Caminicella sporogenes DSM 14501 TaxID=1121266 RepID=A0A1M6R1Q8_9FIRM|nr:tetratricopeptide repeat protein [Caminicella sporogenes]RKD27283.1 hypothetical protein BET04_09065 [Caminicella sporogenes]SHK26425.1 Tetratricopeptide repeat-containing protein [Caminicella sporogenes DSM 14501]